LEPSNDDDFKIARIIMQCSLDIEVGLNAYLEMEGVKESLEFLLNKFGDQGDIFFFKDLLADEVVGFEKDSDHLRKGWNKNLFVKWAKIMQDLDRNKDSDIFKIKAIRDRLYFFFKPAFFENQDIMQMLLIDSGDNVSNFLIEVEPLEGKDIMGTDDIVFFSKEWRSNRLVLDKNGFRKRQASSDKHQGD